MGFNLRRWNGTAWETAGEGTFAVVAKPEAYWSVADGADYLPAFQRAANVIHAAGGGELLLEAPEYYLGEYTPDQVATAAGDTVTGTSRTLVMPRASWRMRSAGHTVLRVLGGSSTPFGWSTSASILVWPGEETGVDVTAVSNTARTATVTSAAGLAVGQTVTLSREGGLVGAIPNTPSMERAPLQFLTITSIVGSTLTFAEAFVHDFASVQDLQVHRPDAGDYPHDVSLIGVTIEPDDTNVPYVLFSRTRGVYVDQVNLVDASMSWGMCQGVNVGTLTTQLRDLTAFVSCEATTHVTIGTFETDGAGSTQQIGPLLFSDNCRDIKVGHYTARRWAKTGLGIFYGFDGRFDSVTLTDCATSVNTLTEYGAALSVGIPAQGAAASLAIADAAAFKRRNVGETRVHIGKLTVKGACQLPVRAHDAHLSWDEAYLEFANPDDSTSRAPIMFGQSGNRRADALFTAGGEGSLDLGPTTIVTKSGTPRTISTANGVNGPMRQADGFLTADAASAATTLVVDNGERFRNGDAIYFFEAAATAPAPTARTVSSVSGNTLTLSAGLPSALATGTGVWRSAIVSPRHTRKIRARRVVLDGIDVPVLNGEESFYPEFIGGSAPYTYAALRTVPARGEWVLYVALTSNDHAHHLTARYHVIHDLTNGSFPMNSVTLINKAQVRTSVDAASATISSAGVVTVNLTSGAAGKLRLVTRWEPVRQMLTSEL